MSEYVNWKDGKRTDALGRNGQSLCTGVELMEMSTNVYDDLFIGKFPSVEISPLNTRSGVTRCHIDIPVESIPEVIKELEKIYMQEKFFVEEGEQDVNQ